MKNGLNVGQAETQPHLTGGNILYVGGSGPNNYTSIQDAVNNASNGDTIFVYSGIYYEHVVVNKSINLIGEDRNTTIIDGSNSGNVVKLTANGVTIENFTIRKGKGTNTAGIKITSDGNMIKNCKLYRNTISIFLSYAGNNNITHCQIYDSIDAVDFLHSSYNTIYECHIWGNEIGCYLDRSINNTIAKSNIYNNEYTGVLAADLSTHINYIHSNNIWDNLNGVITKYKASLNATYNWWGSSDGPSGTGNGSGDGVVGNVSYIPWLSQPVETEPVVAILNPLYGSIVRGIVNISGIAFHPEGIEKVEIKIDNGTWENVTGKNEWYYLWNASNLTGWHSIYARAWNNTGYVEDFIKIYVRKPSIIIYVDDDFEDNATLHQWNTIQEGINDAWDNDIVFVYNGTYHESIVINRKINLIGESMESVVIDANGYGRAVKIAKHGVKMKNFTIINFTSLGIECGWSNNVSISYCNLTVPEYGWGIEVYRASDVTVSHCYVKGNGEGVGIEFDTYANNSFLWNTVIENCRAGLEIITSYYNKVMYCRFLNNTYWGICIAGDGPEVDMRNEITNCGIKNNGYKYDGCGIYIHSKNNLIYANNFINNIEHVYVATHYRNFWNRSIGNYWDDYNGKDNDGDGIGDEPYYIGWNEYDYKPLVNPWHFPPYVFNVKVNPSEQKMGRNVKISCVAIDDERIEEAKINISFPDGSYVNKSMMKNGDEYYYISSYNVSGIYSFYIYVKDNDNYSYVSSIYNFSIKFYKKLYQGWNFITLPCKNNYTALSLYNSIEGCNIILKWNNSKNDFDVYVPGSPYNFAIENGIGYFLSVSSNTNFSIFGAPIVRVNITLLPGWNSLGCFNSARVNASSIYNSIAGCSIVLKWNNSKNDFDVYVANAPDFVIEQGDGFFVAVSQQSHWHGI